MQHHLRQSAMAEGGADASASSENTAGPESTWPALRATALISAGESRKPAGHPTHKSLKAKAVTLSFKVQAPWWMTKQSAALGVAERSIRSSFRSWGLAYRPAQSPGPPGETKRRPHNARCSAASCVRSAAGAPCHPHQWTAGHERTYRSWSTNSGINGVSK